MTENILPWYADFQNVLDGGRLLVDTGVLDTVQDVIDYFNKPWNWENELREAKATHEAGNVVGLPVQRMTDGTEIPL